MEVRYDKEAKALYIRVSNIPDSETAGIVERTVDLVADEIMVDYMMDGKIYGIEILCVDEIRDITAWGTS